MMTSSPSTEALASQFEGTPFEVRTVFDGREGLALLLADQHIAVAYCDVMMKDFTGIELYETVERHHPQRLSSVVLMTAGAFTERAQTFLDQRPHACVQKPFDIVADARRRLGG